MFLYTFCLMFGALEFKNSSKASHNATLHRKPALSIPGTSLVSLDTIAASLGMSTGAPMLSLILPHRLGKTRSLDTDSEAVGRSPHPPSASTRGWERDDAGNYSHTLGGGVGMWGEWEIKLCIHIQRPEAIVQPNGNDCCQWLAMAKAAGHKGTVHNECRSLHNTSQPPMYVRKRNAATMTNEGWLE
jgi:hypothetical protein